MIDIPIKLASYIILVSRYYGGWYHECCRYMFAWRMVTKGSVRVGGQNEDLIDASVTYDQRRSSSRHAYDAFDQVQARNMDKKGDEGAACFQRAEVREIEVQGS